MTLDDLRAFVDVCAAENLSAVARDWGCSQSAISQHVRRLEQDFGMPLLERGRRGAAPTAAGRILWRAATDSLASLSAATRQLEQLRLGEAGSLRLATGGSTVRRFMADAIRDFRARHPQVSLDIHSDSSTQRCLDALRADRADLAFVTMGAEVTGIEQRAVIGVPWLLVVAADEPLARRVGLTPSDLPDAGYVALPDRSSSQRQLATALAERGVQPSAAATVEDWETALLLVELGLGWTIVPATHLEAGGPSAALVGVPIDGLPEVSFGWATRRFDALSAVALEFAADVTAGILGHTSAGARLE